jgi:hypothetical protein
MDKPTREAWLGGNNISSEAIEKRKEINKKILKFGCLPIVALFVMIMMISVFSEDSAKTSEGSFEPSEYNDPLKIGMDSVKSLMGQDVPYDKWGVWGHPETLEGTTNRYWVVYLDSANISFVSDKSTDKILFASFEASSAINYIKDVEKKKKELLEKQFSAWDGSHLELTKIIKKSMNDPNSYEHEETVYWEMNDHLIVRTTFRGKNAFGGVVKNWVKAKTDIQTGQVLQIIEQGPN